MDVQIRTIAVAVATTLALAFSAQSFAQEDATKSTAGADAPVHCDSGAMGARTYCGRENVRYAIESPSQANCVENKTWGSDEKGVWVSGGCDGDFDGRAKRHHSTTN